jgi:hypothetical protein
MKGFDFHAGNLTTARRAEASSEGGMDTDARGIFKMQICCLRKKFIVNNLNNFILTGV